MLVRAKAPTPQRSPTGRLRAPLRMACALALGLGMGLSPGRLALSQPPELVPPNREAPAAPAPPADPTPPLLTANAGLDPDAPKLSLAEALGRPGDLTFRNTTIAAALFTIGETWKVNIVTGKEIEGTVNGVFKQAPLSEILDAILLANGYSYRAVGDSLVVQPSTEVGSAHPLFRSVTLPIAHSTMDEVVEGAKLLVSAAGQVQALPSARSVLVIDYADRVESVTSFIRRMESAAAEAAGARAVQAPSRLEVAYFHTHFIPAASAQQPLLAVLSPLGRVAVMPVENRLLVVDYATNLEMVRKVLERIDRPRPQVRITALIYDLSLADVEQLGLNWGSAGKGNTVNADGVANQALEFETTTLAPFAAGEAAGALTVRSLTRNFDINSVVLLLQNANDARLLADPNVIVMDNEMAECKSVSEIPYQQITQSELGGQIGTTAFKEAGITLRVRPTIAGDGTIAMLVEPEFSRLAGFTPQENQPIIDSRRASTTVRVLNRQTLVLSGLRQRSDTGEFNGIPFLKDVKYVGSLFRSRNTNVRESELIVFIMPEIIGYDEAPNCRQYQALETIDCRLDRIPAAEGCPPLGPEGYPCGIDGCSGISSAPLEPPAGANPSPMRPAYEARFRANSGTDLRREISGGKPAKPPESKKSLWQRTFGS